jgi:hypothetical protein
MASNQCVMVGVRYSGGGMCITLQPQLFNPKMELKVKTPKMRLKVKNPKMGLIISPV